MLATIKAITHTAPGHLLPKGSRIQMSQTILPTQDTIRDSVATMSGRTGSFRFTMTMDMGDDDSEIRVIGSRQTRLRPEEMVRAEDQAGHS